MFEEAVLSRGPGPGTPSQTSIDLAADAPLGKPVIRMKLCALLYLLL
jgi:hypothetical protein